MRFSNRSGWGLLLASTMLSSPALAQSGAPIQTAPAPPASPAAPDNQAVGVQDIVVTAQKRSQSINEVPLTITAVSGDTLTERHVEDVADLVKVVPGLTYTPTAYSTPVYTIRGVGYFDNALATAPAVSVYVDEVPLAFPTMTEGATLDLERVEVLKGPQGTLYGQNSTGGAINFIAAKPTKTWQAGFDAGFSRFNTADFDGFVSGPLSDTLGVRAAIKTTQGGAWQYSSTRDDRLGQVDRVTGRLLFDWKPTDRLRFELSLNGWRDRSDTQAGQVNAVVPTKPSLASADLLNNYPIKDLNARVADWTPGKDFSNHNYFYSASFRGDLDLGSGLTLTSITAYQHLRQDELTDTDGYNEANADVATNGHINSVSQELRLAGTEGPVTWIVGGNYSHANITDDEPADLSANTSNQPVPTVPRFAFIQSLSRSRIENYAGFANAEVKVARGLSIVGGLRYTEARNHYVGCTASEDAASAAAFTTLETLFKRRAGLTAPVVPVAVGSCLTLIAPQTDAAGAITNPATAYDPGAIDQSLNQHNLSYHAGVNYRTPGNTLLYASYSRGYKAGGFSVLLASSTAALTPATQERVDAYEVGFKAPLFDRRVQFNAAAFYYDYANKQIRSKLLDPSFGLLPKLLNVPKSRVAGGEAEIQAQPFRGLDLRASATYADTKVQEFQGYDFGSTIVNLAGSQFPYTPKLTTVTDAQYTWAVDDRHELFLGAATRHNSTSYGSFIAEDVTRIRAYTVVDLRGGVQAADGKWRLSLWADNVTNEYYWTGVYRATDTYFRLAARPVTYGATFSARFK